jgi:hypothetical protein
LLEIFTFGRSGCFGGRVGWAKYIDWNRSTLPELNKTLLPVRLNEPPRPLISIIVEAPLNPICKLLRDLVRNYTYLLLTVKKKMQRSPQICDRRGRIS